MSSLAEPLLTERTVVGVYDPAGHQPQLFTYRGPSREYFGRQDLLGSRWWQPVVERLREVVRLPRDWDSYGGIAVRTTNAATALWFLSRFLPLDAAPPWVVPLGDGGVQLEWHRPGLDLEVVISDDASEVAIDDAVHGFAWEGGLDEILREPPDDLTMVVHTLRAA